jgi:hypothetical protein
LLPADHFQKETGFARSDENLRLLENNWFIIGLYLGSASFIAKIRQASLADFWKFF